MQSGPREEKSFKERLDIIKFHPDLIPDHFIDHYVTHDIMIWPIEVTGKSGGKFIMDHSSLMKFSLVKLQEWDKKTQSGSIYYDAVANPGLVSIGGGNEAMYEWRFLPELRKEIEAWVIRKETEYLIAEIEEDARKKEEEEARIFLENLRLQKQKCEEENARMLKKIEADITETNRKIEALLDPENVMPETQKETEISNQLYRMDLLNKSKSKLLLGEKYYDSAEVLEYEIKRLLDKKETAALVDEEIRDRYFNQEDQEELDHCLKQLDLRTKRRMPGVRHYRPGLFQLFPLQEEANAGIPVFSIFRLGRNGDEH